jgi:hypothetical protein
MTDHRYRCDHWRNDLGDLRHVPSIPVIAVLKIIFDRVEGLKSWGIILGDEEKKQNRLAKRFSRKEDITKPVT